MSKNVLIPESMKIYDMEPKTQPQPTEDIAIKPKDPLEVELDEIEQIVVSNFTELGDKIDKSFTKMGENVRVVCNELSVMIAANSRRGGKGQKVAAALAMSAAIADKAIQAVGVGIKTHKRNKWLRELMLKKHEMAVTKLDFMQGLYNRVSRVSAKHSEMVDKALEQDFDCCDLEVDDNYKQQVMNTLNRKMGMLRKAVFMEMQCQWLLEEYRAWAQNIQLSDYDRPCLLDANKFIAGKLSLDTDIYGTIPPEQETISGRFIVAQSDPMMYGVYLREHGYRIEKQTELIYNLPGNDTLNFFDNNPIMQTMKDYNAAIVENDRHVAKLNKQKKRIMWFSLLLCLFRIYGIIACVIVEIITYYVIEKKKDKLSEEHSKLINNAFRTCDAAAGYVAYERPDLEEKSVVGETLGALFR